MSMSTDMFAEMMDNNAVVLDQYEVVAGHWPDKYNELVLVLSQSGRISDFLTYVLDLRDSEELGGLMGRPGVAEAWASWSKVNDRARATADRAREAGADALGIDPDTVGPC